MKIIAFAVIDKDYINPLRVMLKSFRVKNNIPFKVYKIGNFEVPEDLKNISNVEYIDFKPEKTIKWVDDNFDKFNKKSFEYNVYDDSKIINMFTHLEIEDILLKEYDIVFKTDADIVYFDNIDDGVDNFIKSDKPVGMSLERKNYYNAGILFLNSKHCFNMFENNKNFFEKNGFERFVCLDQDMLNFLFESKIYNLFDCGFINTCIYEIGYIPKYVKCLHYNISEKPWHNGLPHHYPIVAFSSKPYFLKISELFNCDKTFLNKIKESINITKDASKAGKDIIFKYRVEKYLDNYSIARKNIIIEKMKEFISSL